MLAEPAQARFELGGAAEEGVRVVDLVGQQTEIGAGGRRLGECLAPDQGRVLGQDRLLERHQLGPGVQAELRGEYAAHPAQRGQCLRLPAGLVLGQREQAPAVLAQRLRPDQRLEVGEDGLVLPGPDRRLESQLLGVEPQLLETLGLDPAEVPFQDVEEGPAAPEVERLLCHVPRMLGLAPGEQLTSPVQHPVEPLCVDVLAGEHEPVAVAGGLDRVGSQQLAQPHHAALHQLAPRGRWPVAPQGVGELVHRDRLTAAGSEGFDDDAVAPGEVERVAIEGQRPEYLDAHLPSVGRPGGPVNHGNTRAIPR